MVTRKEIKAAMLSLSKTNTFPEDIEFVSPDRYKRLEKLGLVKNGKTTKKWQRLTFKEYIKYCYD